MAEEGLVVQRLAAGRAEVNACLHGARDEDVLAEGSSRVGGGEVPCLKGKGVDARIGRFGEERRARHRDKGLARCLAHLPSTVKPCLREGGISAGELKRFLEAFPGNVVVQLNGHVARWCRAATDDSTYHAPDLLARPAQQPLRHRWSIRRHGIELRYTLASLVHPRSPCRLR